MIPPAELTDPAARPVVHRHTARVLLLDPRQRVLLFHDSDPLAAGRPRFWITPGGGVDDGESVRQAAVREVAEETGHGLPPAALSGPVAERVVVHGYADLIAVQRETYFAAPVPVFPVDTSAHTEEEQRTLLGHHWWTVPELTSTDATVWPVGLAGLVTAVLDGALHWPMPDGEESTVPVPDLAALLPHRPAR